jgi:hypothetical protein
MPAADRGRVLRCRRQQRIEKAVRNEVKADPGSKDSAKAAGKSADPRTGARPDAEGSKRTLGAEAETKTGTAVREVKGRTEGAGERQRPQKASRMLYLLFMLVVTVLLMIGLIYCVPVLVGIHSPISLLIFGIALWQAWKMTRASEMPVTGPYRIR